MIKVQWDDRQKEFWVKTGTGRRTARKTSTEMIKFLRDETTLTNWSFSRAAKKQVEKEKNG